MLWITQSMNAEQIVPASKVESQVQRRVTLAPYGNVHQIAECHFFRGHVLNAPIWTTSYIVATEFRC